MWLVYKWCTYIFLRIHSSTSHFWSSSGKSRLWYMDYQASNTVLRETQNRINWVLSFEFFEVFYSIWQLCNRRTSGYIVSNIMLCRNVSPLNRQDIILYLSDTGHSWLRYNESYVNCSRRFFASERICTCLEGSTRSVCEDTQCRWFTRHNWTQTSFQWYLVQLLHSFKYEIMIQIKSFLPQFLQTDLFSYQIRSCQASIGSARFWRLGWGYFFWWRWVVQS